MIKKEDLVQEEDEISNDMARNSRKMRQIRRFSVFSKSFDPECAAEFSADLSTDFESIANKPFEQSKLSALNYTDCLKKILPNIILFKHLTSDDLDRIIECMFMRVCNPNEVIIRQGDPGNYFYIIVKGIFDVYTNKSSQEVKVAELSSENYFGDLALVHNQPRSASVICRKEAILLCMNRDTFQKKAISISYERRTKYANLIESISFLKKSLNETERSKVVDALESRFFDSNVTVFNENDLADGMYFIESGQVRITQMDSNGNKEIINVLDKGDYFGELALLRKRKRSATAITLSKCKLAFLDVDAFERLMGPCLKLIEKHEIDYYK